MFRRKQRTLPWRFDIQHLPGKTNHAGDVQVKSRHPSLSGSETSASPGMSSIPDLVESALMASICQDIQDIGTISWSLLTCETASDSPLSSLLKLIEQGTPNLARNNRSLAPLWPICESVYAQEGVLLYQDRVIIPSSLRSRVLQNLHANIRDRCADCHRNAPTQAATPPLPTTPPSTLFEAVFADFFTYGGRHYLVIGDRLSGWVEVFGSPAGTTLAGPTYLIHHLRSFFTTFGVPEELSSDGGPEFNASCTEAFLHLWGVRHRICSAHFPQSSGRAEVAVKSAKRLLMSNTGPNGSLDHDRFLRAMLQLHKTPTQTATFPLLRSSSAVPYETPFPLSTSWRNSQIQMYAHSGAKHGLPRRKLSIHRSPAPLSLSKNTRAHYSH